MKRVIITVFLFCFYATSAFAKVNVVATLPFIGDLAKEIGGERIELTVLVKPNHDPHYVEAKPSMILAARKADIIIYNGLDLEIGYLPLLIESSKNPKIQHGEPGNFDCSHYVTAIERLLSVDRSMGDVHPLGNPHYLYSPKNIIHVAEGITDAFSSVDSGNADFYKGNLAAFKDTFNKKQAEWSRSQLKGKRFIAYHNMFSYLAAEFGFQIAGTIEPKPGIPPSAGHIEGLLEAMKRERPDAIIITADAGKKEAEFLTQKTGVKTIMLPRDVGSTTAAKDWFALMDEILSLLEQGR